MTKKEKDAEASDLGCSKCGVLGIKTTPTFYSFITLFNAQHFVISSEADRTADAEIYLANSVPTGWIDSSTSLGMTTVCRAFMKTTKSCLDCLKIIHYLVKHNDPSNNLNSKYGIKSGGTFFAILNSLRRTSGRTND